MRYGHLERVPVELTVKSPLYIGSGQKLTAKECILDARRHVVHIPSLPDMLDAFLNARQKGLANAYMRFMTDPAQKRLADFLETRNIPLDPPPAWVRYSLDAQTDFDKMNGLLTFMRDPEGMAYIPGSSLKGALRTALIAARMGEADKAALWRELEENPRNRRASVVERTLRVLPFKLDRDGGRPVNDAVNDLLRAVQISDSAPFPADALTVCRRWWLALDGEERGGRSPVFMECVRPGTQTTLYLTVDRSLWPAGEEPLACLRRALEDWDALCRTAHEGHFASLLADTACTEGVPVSLGGGTGFQRKSLVYRTKSNAGEAAQLAHRVLREQFTQRNGRSTYVPRGARVAPYMFKAASYEGLLYPMGACELRF